MNNEKQFLGTVQHGQFYQLAPPSASGGLIRLTGIRRQAAMAPESGELNLTGYEGSAIMVRGYDEGGWIFEAKIVDQAGPILTEVVRRVFGTAS